MTAPLRDQVLAILDALDRHPDCSFEFEGTSATFRCGIVVEGTTIIAARRAHLADVITALVDRREREVIDPNGQMAQHYRHEGRMEAVGKCAASGLDQAECKASICDCFVPSIEDLIRERDEARAALGRVEAVLDALTPPDDDSHGGKYATTSEINMFVEPLRAALAPTPGAEQEVASGSELARNIADAVEEAYLPEGRAIWWSNWARADEGKRARMEAGILAAWSGQPAEQEGEG